MSNGKRERSPRLRTRKQSYSFTRWIKWAVLWVGAYDLLTYSYRNGIPFPIDLSVLPTMLFAVGIISVLFYLLLLVTFLTATIFVFDSVVFPKLHHAIRILPTLSRRYLDGVEAKLILLFGPSVSFVLIGFYWKPHDASQIYVFACFACIPAAVMTLFAAWRQFDAAEYRYLPWFKRVRRFFIKNAIFFFSYLSIGLPGIMSACAYFFMVFSSGIVHNENQLGFAVAVFCVANLFMLMPRGHVTPEQLGERDSVQNLEESFSTAVQRFGFQMLAVLLLLSMSLVPSIAERLGALPLRLMNIGGGISERFSVSEPHARALPLELFSFRQGHVCVTRPLVVVLAAGNALDVRVRGLPRSRRPIQLPRSMFHVFPWVTAKEIVLRQDSDFR